VGEWSDATLFDQEEKPNQEYLTAQLQAFQPALGWYFWNFKNLEAGYESWSFESLINDGYDFGLGRKDGVIGTEGEEEEDGYRLEPHVEEDEKNRFDSQYN
jgi:hypothetical protein